MLSVHCIAAPISPFENAAAAHAQAPFDVRLHGLFAYAVPVPQTVHIDAHAVLSTPSATTGVAEYVDPWTHDAHCIAAVAEAAAAKRVPAGHDAGT